jgi:hypothetical protein
MLMAAAELLQEVAENFSRKRSRESFSFFDCFAPATFMYFGESQRIVAKNFFRRGRYRRQSASIRKFRIRMPRRKFSRLLQWEAFARTGGFVARASGSIGDCRPRDVVALVAGCLAVALLAASPPPIARSGEGRPESLFNGRDLTGWEPVGKNAAEDWGVDAGCLVCRGTRHSWLRSNRQFGDFRLALEYQVSPGANSGVYVRVPADGNHHRERATDPPAGFEIQILDDHAPRYAQLKDYQYSASLYDLAGASPRVSKRAGAWNTLVIECRGSHVTVVHNGVRVVDAGTDRHPLLALRNTRGFLGLQSHNGIVRFRKLSVESLDPHPAAVAP